MTKLSQLYRNYWLSLKEDQNAEKMAKEIEYPSALHEMISLAVLCEYEEEFEFGDPYQAALDRSKLSDEQLEVVQTRKAEWIEEHLDPSNTDATGMTYEDFQAAIRIAKCQREKELKRINSEYAEWFNTSNAMLKDIRDDRSVKDRQKIRALRTAKKQCSEKIRMLTESYNAKQKKAGHVSHGEFHDALYTVWLFLQQRGNTSLRVEFGKHRTAFIEFTLKEEKEDEGGIEADGTDNAD